MKIRLDTLLVSKGYFPSREKAKAAIMAGEVFIDGQIFDKAGMPVPEDAEITVKNNSCPYVSRGGLKLEKALKEFNISVKDKTCLDIGASTGGFTDCMLQNGAAKVFAFDVGYGQLDYKLRVDSRVINIEKCNFRYFENLDENNEPIVQGATFASIDVSFISLKHIFPVCAGLLEKDGLSQVVCLVKPQFEAGKEQVGKKGIIKDPKVHIEVIENVISYAVESELYPMNLSYSPITGAKGNIEYLLQLEYKPGLNNKEDLMYNIKVEDIHEIVSLSHKTLE